MSRGGGTTFWGGTILQRDRLVCDVNHPGIQCKLLSEGNLSYKDALIFTQSIESVEDDAKKLGGTVPKQSETVHYTQKGGKPQKPANPLPPHLQPATTVEAPTWLLPAGTMTLSADTAKRKATWPRCAILGLV